MPLPVISIDQMRAWEQATWVSGQTEAEVIRRVGQAIASRALRLTLAGDRILVLAGKGNNGQDARAAIGLLPDRRVSLIDANDPAPALSRLESELSGEPALIIDGLFGIGLNRPLEGDWITLIQRLNAANLPVLAVDVPSGLNADNGQPQGAAVQASVTLTVGAAKLGLLEEPAWPYVGRLEVTADVGLLPCTATPDLQWSMPSDFRRFPPPRPVAAHKGTFGHLAILAGSLGYHGAAVLCARAAQRAQPGLITLHAVENVSRVIAAQLQAVMVSPWHSDGKLPGPWDAILIGPGLASPDLPDQLKMLTRSLWRDSPLPVIVDASALDWLPVDVGSRGTIRVLTPHPGEAARLLRSTPQKIQANRVQALRELSKRFADSWVVLKGHQTLIGRSSGPITVNSSGNPHLAQGGSGDVLSGFIAGLLAQGTLRADVAKTLAYAVWQHGASADLLQTNRSNWVVEDLLPVLGSVPPGCGC